jgi:hypothetical protein
MKAFFILACLMVGFFGDCTLNPFEASIIAEEVYNTNFLAALFQSDCSKHRISQLVDQLYTDDAIVHFNPYLSACPNTAPIGITLDSNCNIYPKPKKQLSNHYVGICKTPGFITQWY